ncbi:MAG TPA: glycosyltransferase family 39 protein [Sphingomicrobium sp.]
MANQTDGSISPPRPGIDSALYPTIAVGVSLIVVLLLNPVGYIGGGQDDARYLSAARCWVEHGMCLPTNHWEGRWPIFAPIAAIIALAGESRLTVQIWPLVSSVAAALLVAEIGRRLFGALAATFIAVLFVSMPTFALQLMTPSVEAIELAFILGSVLCIVNWRSSGKSIWAFAAGLFLGLAVQVRETSLAAAAVIFLALYVSGKRPRLSDLAWAGAGFFLPLAIEFIAYQWVTNDFLYRRHLSLAHTKIPSSQLDPAVDTRGSPILNPAIIGGWQREPGIELHWLVDGPLNILFNARAGFALLLTPLLLFVGRRYLQPKDRRAAWLLLGFAAIYIALINYFFAMDPKPRVMLIALAAGSVALGLVCGRLWEAGRKLLVSACVGSVLVGSALLVAGFFRPVWAEQQAKQWAAQYPGAIEIDIMTRRYVTLAPELRNLPNYSADLPYAMAVSESTCPDWVDRTELHDELTIVDGKRLSMFPRFGRSGRSWVCLFKYNGPVSSERMAEGARQAWLKAERFRR